MALCSSSGYSSSLVLERFATAKEADAAFSSRFPSAPGSRAVYFHGYRAHSALAGDGSTVTRTHAWVADRWVIVADVSHKVEVGPGIAPIALSEALYQAAVTYKLFP